MATVEWVVHHTIGVAATCRHEEYVVLASDLQAKL